jgi:hypothetical protein
VGIPFRVEVTWQAPEPLKHDYPVVLIGRQGKNAFADLDVIQPATLTSHWQAGKEHTESLLARIGPTAGYYLDKGPIDLAVEVRGCYYINHSDAHIGSTMFERTAPITTLSVRTPAAATTQ